MVFEFGEVFGGEEYECYVVVVGKISWDDMVVEFEGSNFSV